MNGLTRRNFLIASAAAAGGLTPLAGLAPAHAAALPTPDVLAAVNDLRKRYHVGPLALNARLQRAAESQAELMAKRDTLSHNLGPGLDLRDRMNTVGFHGTAGENIAAGFPDLASVLDGWMKSVGHRRNLLRPQFSEFGLAYVRYPKSAGRRFTIYWAMEFGGHVLP